MSHSFVQVPPQSTGKKVATEARLELYYSNQVDNISVGDTVVGATSGTTAVVTGVVNEGFAASSGELYLKSATGLFTDGEILLVHNAPAATVDSSVGVQTVYDMQKVVLSDPDNLEYIQKVDRFGASLNTFTDGSPQFGSFGSMMVGESQTIKDYRFAYDSRPDDFYDQTASGGSVTYEADTSAILLTTGTTSGALAKRTSNFYHPYNPGIGHLIEMTIRTGDSGKAGVRRRWGYFDDDNGVFFELDGTTMYVVMRSNSTGSVVETRIPQSEWNRDPLNGTDNINFTLYPDRANIYFIDLQWLGAGRVRFGVVEPEGSRVIGHVFENANSLSIFPYMRTATLPIRIEQENTSAAASTSEMRMVCAVVKHSSKVTYLGTKQSVSTGIITIPAGAGEVPIITFRPKVTVNGVTNRGLMKLIDSTYTNVGTDHGPVVFRFRPSFSANSAVLTGANFQSHNIRSIAEIDRSANSFNANTTYAAMTYLVGAGGTQYVVNGDERDIHNVQLFLNADGTTQPVMIITAECLAAANAQVAATFNWEEIKL